MATGAFGQPGRYDPPIMYTRLSSLSRRRNFVLATIACFIVIIFYVGGNPRSISSYELPEIPITSPFINKPTTPEPEIVQPAFPEEFPRNIWQTGSESMKKQWAEKTDTWISKNPDWKYELLTDDSNTLYVEQHFSHRPALISFWHDLNVTILRADFIRYLTMLAEGGVYSDMDTSCIKQIDKWIPQHLRDEEINAVVGIEYDDNTYPMFVRPISFCQWTLMSKPNHPLFEAVVARVIYHLEYLARIQNTSLSGLKVNKKEVLEATGPGAFTDAVIETLRNGIGKRVDWKDVSGLKEPTMFGDVLVLPIRSFGSGQKHSHSNDEEYGEALAKHHFGRSWYVRPGPDPKADEHPPMPTEEKAEVIPFPVPNENGEENAEESPEEPSTPMSKLKGDNGDDDAKDPMHPLSAERTPPDA